MEGKDLTRHQADVVVTDAVVGNVVIKFYEGLTTFIFDLWKGEFRRSWRGKLAYLLMKPGVERIRGVSCSGASDRACTAWAWLNRNGARWPAVCSGCSHCRPEA